MGRGTICLLVLGLANLLTATELGLDNLPQSEIKEIEAEIAKGNVPPDYTPTDKAKRGVAKLTNTDTPTFNHLSTSSSAGASGVKTATATSQSPYRYVYNNQYYQTSPYISYIQSPQAAQIASQYTFQASPLAHYLQTPTQIQYVSTPSLATARYQTVNTKVAGSTASAGTGSTATTQYNVAPTQQFYISPQSLYQTQTSGSTTHSASSSSQYQTPQQLYYPQQPIVMLLVQQQPNPAALIYPFQNQQQHQQASYVLGQHPFLNIYNNHRFALPYTANNQVTYLVPMAVQTTSAQTVKAAGSDKTTSGIQTSTSGVSYGVRGTKA